MDAIENFSAVKNAIVEAGTVKKASAEAKAISTIWSKSEVYLIGGVAYLNMNYRPNKTALS